MGQLTKTRAHKKTSVHASALVLFITAPNWLASLVTLKINFSCPLQAQIIISRMTAAGSETEMFTMHPFKLTVIRVIAGYYCQPILKLSLWGLVTGDTQREAFIVTEGSLQPSFVLDPGGCFSGWLKPFFSGVLLAVSWLPPTKWMTVEGY